MKKLDIMPCEFCPEGCEHYEPEIETTELRYMGGRPIVREVTLLCAHEGACKARENAKAATC